MGEFPPYSRGFSDGMRAVIKGVRAMMDRVNEFGDELDPEDLAQLLDRYENELVEIRDA